MAKLLTAAEMRVIEHSAMTSGEVTGRALMERAGRAVVTAIFENWSGWAPDRWRQNPWNGYADRRDRWGPAPTPPEYFRTEESGGRCAFVLCGPGNNGGDGFVVARLLHMLGWETAVFFLGDPERLPVDARANYEVLPVVPVADVSTLCDALERVASAGGGQPALIVDALFGIGLSRPLPDLGRLPALWDAVSRAGAVGLVAIDVPSGLDADTGGILRRDPPAEFEVLPAALTVTFHGLKRGHVKQAGPRICGKVVVKDIGL